MQTERSQMQKGLLSVCLETLLGKLGYTIISMNSAATAAICNFVNKIVALYSSA
jgi:hypothetical protein